MHYIPHGKLCFGREEIIDNIKVSGRLVQDAAGLQTEFVSSPSMKFEYCW